VLHVIATWFYLLFLFLLLLTLDEMGKGVELLHKIHNAWFTFSGARELMAYAVVALVIGRFIDVHAKRLHPRLKHNPERGWHYPHK
jgi:hypothetical protein